MVLRDIHDTCTYLGTYIVRDISMVWHREVASR